MRELHQIESPAEHTCGQPRFTRWEVLEPIKGRWSWMTVFHCCEQVALEPIDEAEQERSVRRAA
jgi:hypothetical protein